MSATSVSIDSNPTNHQNKQTSKSPIDENAIGKNKTENRILKTSNFENQTSPERSNRTPHQRGQISQISALSDRQNDLIEIKSKVLASF